MVAPKVDSRQQLNLLLTASLCVTCILGNFLGGVFTLVGVLPLLVIALAISAKSLFSRQNWDMAAIIVFGMVYVGFSFAHAFPSSWTTRFDQSAIPQQALYIVLFPALVVASKGWWSRALNGQLRRELWVLVICCFVLGFVFDAIAYRGISFRAAGTLKNPMLVGILCLIMLYRGGSQIALLAILALAVIGLGLHSYAQNTLCYLSILGVLAARRLVPLPVKAISIVAFITIATLSLLAMPHAAAIWRLDSNTGWRLAFWHDALRAIIDTHGLGVGFGTEAIRSIYPDMIYKRLFQPEDLNGFILIGTHSAFWDFGLRLGVIGLALAVIVLFRSMPSGKDPIDIGIFMLVLICMALNVAIQSPTYAVGVAFAIGLLRATHENRGRVRQSVSEAAHA